MNKKLCVYTCITGNYDNLHEIEYPEKKVDYYCFTNNKNLKSRTWKIIYIKNNGLDNCRLARKIKILGHPKANQYDTVVWSDADVIWQKPVTEFVQKYFKNTSLSIFKHHARNNIRDEAIACLRFRKDNKEIIQKILKFYESVNYPDSNGLCESTVFIKKPQDPKVIETMQSWFNMIENYSLRDQLSFNYAIWKTNLQVKYIPMTVWSNSWFYVSKHTPSSEIKDCHVYYGNPDQDFDFTKYQIYQYKEKNGIYQFNTIIPNNTKEIEFNPTNIIGAEYKNIIINPKPNRINTYDTITINNQKTFFCNDHGTIRAYSNFQKGQKLSFSIAINKPTNSTFNKIIEHQWLHLANLQLKIQSLQNENSKLQNENSKLQTNFQNIINSKGWQTLEKLRKLSHLRSSSK